MNYYRQVNLTIIFNTPRSQRRRKKRPSPSLELKLQRWFKMNFTQGRELECQDRIEVLQLNQIWFHWPMEVSIVLKDTPRILERTPRDLRITAEPLLQSLSTEGDWLMTSQTKEIALLDKPVVHILDQPQHCKARIQWPICLMPMFKPELMIWTLWIQSLCNNRTSPEWPWMDKRVSLRVNLCRNKGQEQHTNKRNLKIEDLLLFLTVKWYSK